jgi:hypothetical protein
VAAAEAGGFAHVRSAFLEAVGSLEFDVEVLLLVFGGGIHLSGEFACAAGFV